MAALLAVLRARSRAGRRPLAPGRGTTPVRRLPAALLATIVAGAGSAGCDGPGAPDAGADVPADVAADVPRTDGDAAPDDGRPRRLRVDIGRGHGPLDPRALPQQQAAALARGGARRFFVQCGNCATCHLKLHPQIARQ